MDINQLNQQLNKISNDFISTEQFNNHKNKLDKEIEKEMINKETINNRIANFNQDTTMYVNPNNNYYTDFRMPQSSGSYNTGNKLSSGSAHSSHDKQKTQFEKTEQWKQTKQSSINLNNKPTFHNKANIRTNNITNNIYNNNQSNLNQYNELFKRENRDDMNEKLNNFNFNNFNYVNDSRNLDNPLINENYYNTGPGIKSNNHGFDKMNDFNIVHTKIERTNNRNLQNERLQNFSPLGRALGAGFTFDINNNLSSVNSKSTGNYKSNYKDLNNERLNNFSPMAKTLSISSKQQHVSSNKNNNNNNNQQKLVNKPVNFNDINPKLSNSVMTYHPINSRIE
jgi:hypothetical protein